jgi:hypothetical protein
LLALLLLLVTAFGISTSADAFTTSRAEFQTQQVLPKPQNPNPIVSQDETALRVGETLTQDIKGGTTQSFKISVSAGQYLRLLVQQRGIILVAKLYDNSRKQVVHMDNPSGGHGPIYISEIDAT